MRAALAVDAVELAAARQPAALAARRGRAIGPTGVSRLRPLPRRRLRSRRPARVRMRARNPWRAGALALLGLVGALHERSAAGQDGRAARRLGYKIARRACGQPCSRTPRVEARLFPRFADWRRRTPLRPASGDRVYTRSRRGQRQPRRPAGPSPSEPHHRQPPRRVATARAAQTARAASGTTSATSSARETCRTSSSTSGSSRSSWPRLAGRTPLRARARAHPHLGRASATCRCCGAPRARRFDERATVEIVGDGLAPADDDRAGRARRRPTASDGARPEPEVHLRAVRDRRRQPLRPRRRAGGRRAARPGLQPALPARAARARQDPPPPRDRQLRPALRRRAARPLRDGRGVHERVRRRGARRGSTARFKDGFRGADVLLIDDVQFLAGRDRRPREEFFHTFNALLESGRQLVLTSDRPPEELAELEARLTERFRSGLVVELEPPGARRAPGDPRASAPASTACEVSRRRARRDRRARSTTQRPRARGRADPRGRLRLAARGAAHARAGAPRAAAASADAGRRAAAASPRSWTPRRRSSASNPRRSSRRDRRAAVVQRPPGGHVPRARAHRPQPAGDRRAASAGATTPPSCTRINRVGAAMRDRSRHAQALSTTCAAGSADPRDDRR